MARHKHGCRHWRRDLDLIQVDLDLDPGGSVSLLKYLTRLLFLTIVTSSAVVLTVSVMMLMQCRQQVRLLEDVAPSQALCSPLTLPAYFVVLVLAVGVCGLGCVGRRVSGGVLVGVSGAALLAALVLTLTHDCEQDGLSVRRAVATKLRQCGVIITGLNSSSSSTSRPPHPPPPSRSPTRGDSLSDPACHAALFSLTTLCSHFWVMDSSGSDKDYEGRTEGSMNETGVSDCAREVWRSLQTLCVQQTEVLSPVLLTLPLFYTAIGLALVYVKHADVIAKAGRADVSSGTCGGGVGTITTTTTTTRNGSTSRPLLTRCVRHVLCGCVTSVCVRRSCCFTCLLRGHPAACCCGAPSPTTITTTTPLRPPSSTQSFPLREVGRGVEGGERGEEEEEEEEEEEGDVICVPMLRGGSNSRSEPHEQIHLMEECV